jgi:hypothetical protein
MKMKMKIKIAQWPQLRQLCWNRRHDAIIDGTEALAIYERNWDLVDQGAMTPGERKLVDQLAERFGNGILMVA